MRRYRFTMYKKCRSLTNEKLISLVDAAKELNYNPITMRELINKHQIRAYKFAGKWYLSKDQFEALKKWIKTFKKGR